MFRGSTQKVSVCLNVHLLSLVKGKKKIFLILSILSDQVCSRFMENLKALKNSGPEVQPRKCPSLAEGWP